MEGLGERPLLLDVRRSEEYVDGHAPGGQLNRNAQSGQAAGCPAFPFYDVLFRGSFCCSHQCMIVLWGSTA